MGKGVVPGESNIRERGSSGLVLRINLLMVGLGSDLPEGEEINSLVPWGWPVFESSVPSPEKNHVEKYGSALVTQMM